MALSYANQWMNVNYFSIPQHNESEQLFIFFKTRSGQGSDDVKSSILKEIASARFVFWRKSLSYSQTHGMSFFLEPFGLFLNLICWLFF